MIELVLWMNALRVAVLIGGGTPPAERLFLMLIYNLKAVRLHSGESSLDIIGLSCHIRGFADSEFGQVLAELLYR